MPRRPGQKQPLLLARSVDHRDVDVGILACVGADHDRLPIGRHGVSRHVMLHALAVTYREVLDPTVGVAYKDLPPLGAALVRCDVEIA
jgi:hypothetical protein